MNSIVFDDDFLNCVSYDGHLCVLGDHHSPIAVSAAGSDQIGVSQLYLKGLHLGSCEPTMQPALRVWLDDGQGWELVGMTERAAWPWGWRETGQTERTRLVQEVWFAANDRLVVRWQVESLKAGTPSSPRLAVGGAFAGAGMSVAGKTEEDGWEWAVQCSGNNLLFRKAFAFGWQLRLKVGRVKHDGEGLPVVEVAGGQSFAGEVALVGGTATATVRAPGFGNFATKLAALASPINWSSTNFFWDSMIALPTLGLIDPTWAAEVVEGYVQHAHEGSLPPPFLNAYPEIPPDQRYQECYAPIASWAVCKLWRCGKAKAPLSRLYPSLRTLHERWFEVTDHDRDGIPEWRNAGCPADNSPLYDRYAPYGADPTKTGCHNLLPHKSVSLESLAVTLGTAEEARHWRERQKWLSGQILEHLWHPDELIFHDRDTTTGEPTRVKTFFSLLPLWAGVDLPETEARRAIERHLLNPKEFWGTVPFPSVAYDEATYDPLGYWRGRTWPHVYFWNTEILSKYGYTREAVLAKERDLAVVSGSREIAENYPSQWSKINQAGMPHYSFGTGTLVHFLSDWHTQPL